MSIFIDNIHNKTILEKLVELKRLGLAFNQMGGILKDSYEQDFKKSNLDPENLFVHVYKNKHGFTGYDITIDVNYYSPEFCGGLFSETFDFEFKHPDCV